MPALQSPWFIPHVTVYMFSYSLLGCAFLMGSAGLVAPKKDVLPAADTLVYIGTAFLTFGMLSGSIWAKSAWGHYWSWDPKEVWALITLIIYGIAFHSTSIKQLRSDRIFNIYIALAFLTVLMTYFGVNYMLGGMHSYAN